MQNELYQSDGSPVASIPTGELIRFIIKVLSYLTYALFVVYDGMNNPESYETKFLTLPYLIGGLALTRSICEALDHHYDFHAGLFALGLSTLSSLA